MQQPNKQQSFFFIPPGDARIQQYHELIAYMVQPDIHTLALRVPEAHVTRGDTAMIAEILVALQHYPQAIEKFILAIDFNFEEIEDSEIYLPATYWKMQPSYYRWFYKLYKQLPFTVFFINDEDARFYCFAGDMMADGVIKTGNETDRGNRRELEFNDVQLEELCHRVFAACHMLLLYCHGSGFNPKAYIEGLLAMLDLPITWQQVYEAYLEDAAKNLRFKIVAQP